MQGKGKNEEKKIVPAYIGRREILQLSGCGDHSYIKNAHKLVRLTTRLLLLN